MIFKEGSLLAPPDRGSIIGRAAWKTRYVVLSNSSTLSTQNTSQSQVEKVSKSRLSLKSPSKTNLVETSSSSEDGAQLQLYIFKNKGDVESLAQYPISAVKCCQVQNVQYRKQTPLLPTLILDFKSDSISTKIRKRRSSRAVGPIAKDPWSNSLLFRPVEDESRSIFDWDAQIRSLLARVTENTEGTPGSRIQFTNPFVGRSASLVSANRPDLQNRSWNQSRTSVSLTSSLKSSEISSPTPSLRSRRSDLSSRASSHLHVPGFSTSTVHATTFPSDLPSPCSINSCENKFVKTRLSTSSNIPITPRETILDRAFQMRFIPGSEGVLSSEDTDKLSSTAKFEALMREHERRQTEVDICVDMPQDEIRERKETEIATSHLENIREHRKNDISLTDETSELSAPALRALNYIQGRPSTNNRSLSSLSKKSASQVNPQTLSILSGHERPTYDSLETKPRKNTTSRMITNRSVSLNIPIRSISSSTGEKECGGSLTNSKIDVTETRPSNSNVKRLSFQEFARRLSSTSSLLLSQTNASSNSGRASGDYGPDLSVNSLSYSNKDERVQRCGWRGSIGKLGVESNFL
ncbi:hypothetical protein K3495_g6445 [Podosphaera aphanis]|nr:hypothetical protein K3495_g6445 [Podosphaera aphanis]